MKRRGRNTAWILDEEVREMERDSRVDARESLETADEVLAHERPKSGVGWGLRKSTGLSLEQKQLIRYAALCLENQADGLLLQTRESMAFLSLVGSQVLC